MLIEKLYSSHCGILLHQTRDIGDRFLCNRIECFCPNEVSVENWTGEVVCTKHEEFARVINQRKDW